MPDSKSLISLFYLEIPSVLSPFYDSISFLLIFLSAAIDLIILT